MKKKKNFFSELILKIELYWMNELERQCLFQFPCLQTSNLIKNGLLKRILGMVDK